MQVRVYCKLASAALLFFKTNRLRGSSVSLNSGTREVPHNSPADQVHLRLKIDRGATPVPKIRE
jgi:hypothetical protein